MFEAGGPTAQKYMLYGQWLMSLTYVAEVPRGVRLRSMVRWTVDFMVGKVAEVVGKEWDEVGCSERRRMGVTSDKLEDEREESFMGKRKGICVVLWECEIPIFSACLLRSGPFSGSHCNEVALGEHPLRVHEML